MTNTLVLILLLILYFTPAMVAVGRNHQSQGGVIVLNLFLGWTFLGWVGALAWACSGVRRPA